MAIHPLAGKPVPRDLLIDVAALVSDYYVQQPDISDPAQRVAFGTSGHRGVSSRCSFNERHILAITQAICEYRHSRSIDGPLFLGVDTHALSEPAYRSALEVLAANGVGVLVQTGRGYTPTPVISHAILTFNRGRRSGLADGIVITPSHNPPSNGGFKYNPPEGGPADTDVTQWIESRANDLLGDAAASVKRLPFSRAVRSGYIREVDFVMPYVNDLGTIIDMEAIRTAGISLGADALGGASQAYWEPLAEQYGLRIEVMNSVVDPAFSFMTVDKDGEIRMDCSSPYAMASLVRLKDRFDIAFGTDPDADRHGIVTASRGLLNPNHYLAAVVWYLYQNRPQWKNTVAVGKTLVSSSVIDRVARHLNRALCEVPVGFKWFVDGLLSGMLGFAGEESAGASFLRMDGTVWTTDKDGIIMCLLAAEITGRTGRDPGELYAGLEERFGHVDYDRLDVPASAAERSVLKKLSADTITAAALAGEPIEQIFTAAPGNNAPVGGLKVVAKNGWFAVRPSGTEDIYKLYAESFRGTDHLRQIQSEAQELVQSAFTAAGTL